VTAVTPGNFHLRLVGIALEMWIVVLSEAVPSYAMNERQILRTS